MFYFSAHFDTLFPYRSLSVFMVHVTNCATDIDFNVGGSTCGAQGHTMCQMEVPVPQGDWKI